MTFEIHRSPFEEDLLKDLAKDLQTALPASPQAKSSDFSQALVILPSSRACQTLAHVLLESQSGNAILLPQTLTMTQVIEELAVALGLAGSDYPDDLVRPLVLAHQLRNESWLEGRPESAPGLAEEFVGLFDEVRLHGCTQEVLEEGPLEDLTKFVNSDAAADLEQDLLRIHRVWQLYRQCVGFDNVDLLCEMAKTLDEIAEDDSSAISAAMKNAFGRDFLLVAGFANLDPQRAGLLRHLGHWSGEARLYLPETTLPLSRFFVSTWESSGELDPLAPARLVSALVAPGVDPDPKPEPRRTLVEKVAELEQAQGNIQPDGPLELLACRISEEESRVVANRVVEILQKPGGNLLKTAVVTNDPVLAARIVAQLRDAGVDTDQTLGAPLSSLPAGLLLRFLLRTALTDFRAENLLEVVTHPFVKPGAERKKVQTRNLRLEKMLRRNEGGQPGAKGLVQLAQKQDEAARNLYNNDKPDMAEYVGVLLDAFAPLTQLINKGPQPWVNLLMAVTTVWNSLCPDELLEENREKSDLTAVARLLGRLKDNAHRLPTVSLAGLSSDLGRLLSAESVAPHRGKAKPVLITGTVEARLEKYDHLILAGMAEGKFPARRRRPLFLNAALRHKLGLPDWRRSVSRDAALFLRLLYNAPKVLVTWPTEEIGRPVLPSPFVERLALALPNQDDPPMVESVPQWRKSVEEIVDIQALQKQFKAESLGLGSAEKLRPLNRLSWSALRTWRECPYRHLLARGFLLHKEDEVREEFGRRDYGSLVHASLHAFLTPGNGGYEALLGGQSTKAEDILKEISRGEFMDQGDDTAGRRLWLANFQRSIPALVEYELKRFKDWRPVLLEQEFELPLDSLLEWLGKENSAGDLGLDLPSAPTAGEPIVLRGVIDRVDEKVTAADPQLRQAAIIDYKTGKIPTAKDVSGLNDLQILLYTVALESGAMLKAAAATWLVSEGFYYGITKGLTGAPKTKHLICGDPEGRALLADGALALAHLAMDAADHDQEFTLIPAERSGEGEKNLPCRYCDFRGVCRLEDRELPGPTELKLDKMVNRKDGAW